MILYWSSKPQDTSQLIRANANSVEINPIDVPRSEEHPYIFIHKQGNGQGLSQNVGWNELVTFTVSEDEHTRTVTVGGETYYIFELVKQWRRAPFMWIADVTVNGGEILAVSHFDVYKDTAIQEMNDMNESTYTLLGKVFHYNYDTKMAALNTSGEHHGAKRNPVH